MSLSPAILYSIIGGFTPALVWLLFFLHEDKRHPEPRRRLIIAFAAGMLVVPLVIPVQLYIEHLFGSTNVDIGIVSIAGLVAVTLSAASEEVFKFLAAYFGALKKRVADEPIDMVIYMLTAALGFAAVENALFLFTPIYDAEFLRSVVTGNMRFVGANLLHVLSSSVIGVALAFAYYKNRLIKAWALACGLLLAVVLHAAFNFYIINHKSEVIFIVFAAVWIGIIIVLYLFEKIKRLHGSNLK